MFIFGYFSLLFTRFNIKDYRTFITSQFDTRRSIIHCSPEGRARRINLTRATEMKSYVISISSTSRWVNDMLQAFGSLETTDENYTAERCIYLDMILQKKLPNNYWICGRWQIFGWSYKTRDIAFPPNFCQL